MKKNKKIKYYMNIIKKIENVRKKNNINWMDLLRLSFKSSPEGAKKILNKIYTDDKKISKHLKKLND